jgi:Homeodomain-like domain
VATMGETLARWHVDVAAVRERERWHALWLLARGWSATQVAEALGRDPHTVGAWLRAFKQGGPPAVAFEQTGGAQHAAFVREYLALVAEQTRAKIFFYGLKSRIDEVKTRCRTVLQTHALASAAM